MNDLPDAKRCPEMREMSTQLASKGKGIMVVGGIFGRDGNSSIDRTGHRVWIWGRFA